MALPCCSPSGPAAPERLRELRDRTHGTEVCIESVHLVWHGLGCGTGFAGVAVAITCDVGSDADAVRKEPLLIRLVNEDGKWLVDRIGMRVTAPITRRLTDGLKKHFAFPGMI